MSKIKLYKPVTIDGEEKTELEFDLDNLMADSVEQAIKTLGKKGHIVTVQETDPILHATLFAIAAEIDYTDMTRLHAKDYLKAGIEVRNFFFIDLEDSSQKSI